MVDPGDWIRIDDESVGLYGRDAKVTARPDPETVVVHIAGAHRKFPIGDVIRLVEACPDCDIAGSFRRRSGNRPEYYQGDPEATYRCTKCGHCFDDPDRRPAKGNRKGGPRNVSDADLDAARRALGIGVDG